MRIIIYLILIASLNQVFSLTHYKSNNVKSTLQNLKKILLRMKDFTNHLQELQDELQSIKKSKGSGDSTVTTESKPVRKPFVFKWPESKEVTEKQPLIIEEEKESKVEEKVNKVDTKRSYAMTVQFAVNSKYRSKSRHERCKAESSCSHYPKVKKSNGDKSNIPYDLKGEIIKGCENKYYFFGTQLTKKFSELWQLCCKLGFVPITIKSMDDLQCINSLFKKSVTRVTNRKKETYMVTANDIMLDGNFWICEENRTIPDKLWAPKQPDNWMKIESCAGIILSSKDADIGYADFSCSAPGPILCEAEVEETTSSKRSSNKN